ncbi:nitroreductase family protein [Novosphingobium sp. KCTC 2891]|uniref:nitroreductase family protein n=1 Tax=Novosphingobium sp. KCTC 2891 TaxID=2989730 RepID=UPI0022233907|nr:nitroreductase family protein [Novosphingobium sp. KCTC 2891]MCW1381373.1 nitroreductase family protein [Novosphingobium sp. KCTC 2891]
MTARTTDPRVLPAIADRWSPRSFDGSAVPAEDLAVILEAASLAPSAYNQQPWRFLYAVRGDANWDHFVSLLVPGNAVWAKDAGALLFAVSETTFPRPDGAKPNRSHSFDAGSAWALLALQATHMGYHAHAMVGMEFPRVRQELAIPEDFHINAAIVIGRKDAPEKLPDGYREREAPSGRKPVSAFAVGGKFTDLPAD